MKTQPHTPARGPQHTPPVRFDGARAEWRIGNFRLTHHAVERTPSVRDFLALLDQHKWRGMHRTLAVAVYLGVHRVHQN